MVLHSVSHSGLSQAASLTLTLYFQTDLSLSGNIENVLLIYDSFFVFSSIIEFKKNLGRAKVFLDKGLNIGMAAILLGRMTHHLARPKWNSQIRTDREAGFTPSVGPLGRILRAQEDFPAFSSTGRGHSSEEVRDPEIKCGQLLEPWPY